MAFLFNTLALAFAAALGVLYLYGVEHSFLWIYPWFDVFLHFFGGLVMGFWACAVSARLSLPLRSALVLVITVALAGGVFWEGFEYVFDLKGGFFDSLSDLSLGVVGALVSLALYAILHRFRT